MESSKNSFRQAVFYVRRRYECSKRAQCYVVCITSFTMVFGLKGGTNLCLPVSTVRDRWPHSVLGLPGGSVDGTRRDSKLTDNGSVGHPGFHLEVAKFHVNYWLPVVYIPMQCACCVPVRCVLWFIEALTLRWPGEQTMHRACHKKQVSLDECLSF